VEQVLSEVVDKTEGISEEHLFQVLLPNWSMAKSFKMNINWAPVAHTCNPSYSGDRDQEDHGLKSAWANSLQDPILKHPSQKKGGWGLVEWLKV
jgi:hypothetical protein